MNHSLIKIVKWFCWQLTFNELASAVVIFLEVLNYSRKDIAPKANEKPPHYREFRVDVIPPLAAKDTASSAPDWQKLKKEKELETGKIIIRKEEGISVRPTHFKRLNIHANFGSNRNLA